MDNIIFAEQLNLIAENQQKVYDAGYEKGKSEGGSGEGVYYDEFWDAFQENGNRTHYPYAFGTGWTDLTFKPKYDIKPKNAASMFTKSNITDLKGICEQQNITLDFSQSTNLATVFSDSKITHLGVIDTRGANIIFETFKNAKSLVSIEKLILRDDGSQTFNSDPSQAMCCYTFAYTKNLTHIIVEGVIGQNNFTMGGKDNLSKESIISIINALSTTTDGLTVYLPWNGVSKAFETKEGENDGRSSDEWQALIATRSNWNIVLINSF